MKTLILLAGLLSAGAAAAQYKCVGTDGRTQYQQTPCASAERETKLKLFADLPQPAPRARDASGPRQPDAALSGPPEGAALISLYQRWADADRLASATARVALSGPVRELQAIAREASALKPERCMDRAATALQTLTSGSAEGYLQFMVRQEVQAMVYNIVHRPDGIAQFEHEMRTANCGRPK